MVCCFCVIGKGGLQCLFQIYEIVDQVLSVCEVMDCCFFYIVFMGMGEFLFNSSVVLEVICCFNDDFGIG